MQNTSVYMKQFSIPLLNYLYIFFMFVLLAGKHQHIFGRIVLQDRVKKWRDSTAAVVRALKLTIIYISVRLEHKTRINK